MRGDPVNSEEFLYRRGFGPPDKRYLNPNGSATSRTFKPRPQDNGQLSVNVKSLTTAMKTVLNNPIKYVLFEIDVKDVLDTHLSVDHDPEDDNEAHAIIYTIADDDDATPGLLARKSRRIYLYP